MTASSLSLKKRIALEIFSIKRGLETLTHDLRYLFWEATVRCNLKCLHCGSDCTSHSDMPDMPLLDFLNVLDSIRQKRDPRRILVCITGGEPLVRHDLPLAGAEISKRGFPWGIVTNGMLMTDAKFESLLCAGISSMAISLDGPEAEHNWFRGNPNSCKKAMQTIRLAASALGQNPGFMFDVVTCVNQRTICKLDIMKKKLVDLGVPKWRCVSVFPKGRAAENEELSLSGNQLRQLMEFIKATRAEGLINVSYGCEGYIGAYEMDVRDRPFFCQAGIGIGSILVDGSISACPSLRADYIQGSIYQSDFLDVWENRFSVMRNRKWARTGECATCSSWRYCHGNGLHLRDEKSGKLLFCNLRGLHAEGD